MATETKKTATNKKTSSSSGFLSTVQKDVKPAQAFLSKFNNDWSMNLSAALAYNLLTAMFPILVALVSILGFFLGTPEARQNLIKQILSVLPSAVNSQALLSAALAQLSRVSGILGLIALVLAIFGGSRLFVLIESCFCIIYRVRPRKIIAQNIMAIGMLLVFVILIPLMIFAASLPGIVLSFLQQTPLHLIPGSGLLLGLGGFIGGVIVSWILFQVIYIVVPNQRISFRHSWLGAVIAAIALELYLTLFSLYASRFLNGYVGQVGFAIILLTFFYYFAVILLIGAEVNAFFSEHVQPLPNDLATFVSTMAGKLNQDIPDVESSSHLDPKPTNKADRAHVEREAEDIGYKRVKQAGKADPVAPVPATTPATHVTSKQEKQAAGSSRLTTAIEVVIGSLLAMGIELLRLRRRGKI